MDQGPTPYAKNMLNARGGGGGQGGPQLAPEQVRMTVQHDVGAYLVLTVGSN